MPNPIYPGAVWYPGAHANYESGTCATHAAVCHFTVGRNSLDLVARDGLAAFLISRGGDEPNSPGGRATVFQTAPVDALTYHAGSPFNGYGPGLEVEFHSDYHATMFTDDQLRATGDLVLWLSREWGIVLDYYDTDGNNDARVWDHAGFLSHRACQSSADWHYDYWSREDWNAMLSGPVPVPEPPRKQTTSRSSKQMAHISFQVGNHYDSYRVDDDGIVVHSWWPNGPLEDGSFVVATEVVGRGVKPRGEISGTFQTTGDALDRTDLYAEHEDGTLVHFFQSSTDWKWIEDGVRW